MYKNYAEYWCLQKVLRTVSTKYKSIPCNPDTTQKTLT